VEFCLTYRHEDAGQYAFNIKRQLARLAPDIPLTAAPVRAGDRPRELTSATVVLMLVGSRWLKSTPKGPSLFATGTDGLRQLLESALKEGRSIVPVLCRVSSAEWAGLCRQLPPSLEPLATLIAVELSEQDFDRGVERLVARLRTPRPSTTWAENKGQTTIRIESEAGGFFKWWSNGDISLRVLVDDDEVGGLRAWDGKLEAVVKPGSHVVQVRQGPFAKTAPVTVQVDHGEAVTLVCSRNILTSGLSLARKG
jgi:hypothetical protein